MFDQSFLNSPRGARKPATIFASFIVQIACLGLLVLISIAYTQALPSAQLKGLLIAPRAPMAAVPLSSNTSRPSPASRVAAPRFVFTPPNLRVAVATRVAPLGPAPPVLEGGDSGPSGTDIFQSGDIPFGPGTGAPAPAPPSRVADKPQHRMVTRVSEGVAAANLVYKVLPAYPSLAKTARIQGSVQFRAVINKQGQITELQLLSGHPLLVHAAEEAIRQWRYRPTLLNGQAVEVVTEITVNFTLSN
ncbi:MAG: energy transducer TonB [Acidobacteriaceae bacterium]|nr:energy transducer TonB [Acidobacteriaceae bacterium]